MMRRIKRYLLDEGYTSSNKGYRYLINLFCSENHFENFRAKEIFVIKKFEFFKMFCKRFHNFQQ